MEEVVMKSSILTATLLATAVVFSSAAFAQDKNANKDSVKFIKAAIQGNIAEVDAGKLAQEKGKSAGVKQYGAMLEKDHSAANEKAIAAAKSLGVEPPTGSSVGEKATYVKWKVLTGDTFDRSFAKGMVKDHEKDIKEYEKASMRSDATGTYAKETLPILKEHLKAAQTLNQQVQTKQSMR
jgi:putative membrane protein